MANSDKNILITPSVGLSTNPTIKFNGANNTPTTLRVLDDGTVSFEGTAGQLFSVADGMTGTIFSVNDVSGIPNIEVLDTALVKLNQYQGQSVFGSSAAISNTDGNPAQVSIVPKNQITPALIIKSAPENTATITNITGSGSTVTYTALNTFSTNQYVTITGANPSAYNLTNAFITSVSSTQFTVSNTATGTYVSGGTATTVGQNAANPIFEIQSSSGSAILSVDASANNPTVRAFQFMSGYHGSLDNSVYMSTFGGTAQIYGNTAASTILKVTGAPSQSGNLQEWITSGGQSLTRVRSSGQFGIGSVITGTALVVNLDILGAGAQGMVIRGAASQTGDLALLQASDGTTLLRFNAQGQVQPLSTAGQAFTIKGVASQSLNLQEWQNSAGTVLARIDNTGNAVFLNTTVYANQVYVGNGNYLNATMHNVSGGAAEMRLLLRAHSSQTANIQEWQNSSGTVLSNVASNGRINAIQFGNVTGGNAVITTAADTGSIRVNTNGAANKGLVVQGTASQTANLQEWQDSAGTVITRIDSSGQNIWTYSIRPQVTPTSGSFIQLDSNQVRITQQTAGAVAFIVKGAASQTANLQEWQDSTGTVLAKVDAYGYITSSGAVLPSGNGSFESAYGGAFIGMKKTTSAVANPVADVARMYLVAGTTAGTLKLVIKAGTAGAETTILDNIPQS